MAKSQVTENGFELELYTDKQERYQEKYKDKFGNELDVSAESIASQMIDIDSAAQQESDLVAQSIYNSFDRDQAAGIALDFNVSLSGTTRLEALKTRVKSILRGDSGTVIPLGKLAALSSGAYQFALVENVTIDESTAVECYFTISTIANSTAYSLSVNSTTYTYTSDTDATLNEILIGLRDAVNGGSLDVTAVVESERLRIYSDNYETLFAFATVTANIAIDEIGAFGLFDAVDAGAVVVAAETLIVIVNAVSGWNSLINIFAGTTGRSIEKDDELRARANDNTQIAQCGTDQGIEKAVQENVSGVTSVAVNSNRESTVVDGQDPKTFQVIVVGGDDAEIAEYIFPAQPSGVKSFGNTSEIIVDKYDNNQTIYFSRPEDVYVWVEYEVETDSNFPVDGISQINDSILAFATDKFSIGDDVKIQELYEPVFDILGVLKINSFKLANQGVLTPVPGPGDYNTNNITIGIIEISNFAVSRMDGTAV